MNEHNTWEFLRDIALPLGHYSRIESPDTAPGFPDVHYTIQKKVDRALGLDQYVSTGTIELKYARHIDPPFPNEDVGLHRTQLIWINTEVSYGGTVWIMAELQTGLILCIPGRLAPQFNGASREGLTHMATETIHRSHPEEAALTLWSLLHDD